MEAKQESHRAVLENIIKNSSDGIYVRVSRKNPDVLVFYKIWRSKEQELVRSKIDDALYEAIACKAKGWIKKICSIETVNINNPKQCSGSTVLCHILKDKSLHDLVGFLRQRGARLTAEEVLDFPQK
jgi:hypothetical protein